MAKTVEKLLQPGVKKTLTVSMSTEQMEMLDKLALFFAKKSGQRFSPEKVAEEALGDFIDESVNYIDEQYEVNIRTIPISELEVGASTRIVNVLEIDTLIVPAKDSRRYEQAFFQDLRWDNIRTKEAKLRHARYMAVYVGSPTSGITHYAKITSYEVDAAHPGKFTVYLEGTPHALSAKIVADDPATAAGMRSCRYTSLKLLQQAVTLQDLFPKVK